MKQVRMLQVTCECVERRMNGCKLWIMSQQNTLNVNLNVNVAGKDATGKDATGKDATGKGTGVMRLVASGTGCSSP